MRKILFFVVALAILCPTVYADDVTPLDVEVNLCGGCTFEKDVTIYN